MKKGCSFQERGQQGVSSFDDVVSNGVADKGCCRMKVKFKHDASPIKFHGPGTDLENRANLLIGFAISQEIENLAFSRTRAAGGQFAFLGCLLLCGAGRLGPLA